MKGVAVRNGETKVLMEGTLGPKNVPFLGSLLGSLLGLSLVLRDRFVVEKQTRLDEFQFRFIFGLVFVLHCIVRIKVRDCQSCLDLLMFLVSLN